MTSRSLFPVAVAALLATAAVGLGARPPQGFAQDASDQASTVDAATVAGSVQSFYDRTSALEARFRQAYYYRIYDRYERSSGQVVFQKGGKMRWNYDEPNGKVIVADGRRLVIFEPGEGEDEPPQAIARPMSQHQLPRAFSFLTGEGRLAESFRFRLLDAGRHGFSSGFVLELRDRQPNPHYDRILFYVAGRNGRPLGVVRRVLIVDEAGNRNRFDFENVRFDPNVPNDTFAFDAPAGTRWVRP